MRRETKRLYHWCLKNNIKVVFITGRQPDVYEATEKNLKEQGSTEYEKLITRSERTSKMSAIIFKNYERGILADQGYNIVLCVRDQWSDLEGDNLGLPVKLPNYLYLID